MTASTSTPSAVAAVLAVSVLICVDDSEVVQIRVALQGLHPTKAHSLPALLELSPSVWYSTPPIRSVSNRGRDIPASTGGRGSVVRRMRLRVDDGKPATDSLVCIPQVSTTPSIALVDLRIRGAGPGVISSVFLSLLPTSLLGHYPSPPPLQWTSVCSPTDMAPPAMWWWQ
ncbi:hypothetical protein C8J57DRAFT_1331907 [Mycena rebaudengoi]|nr:hypothetical protein C8J57DRAFT_1331907 [Mycena rebaudengoi]